MSVLLPVVDGDDGADIYGYVTNADAARRIAEDCFADEISHVERYGPIKLANGEILSEAFVVITKAWGTA